MKKKIVVKPEYCLLFIILLGQYIIPLLKGSRCNPVLLGAHHRHSLCLEYLGVADCHYGGKGTYGFL